MAELAVIGTVGSIAASGAKLAVLLYSFSTTVAGAKKEVASVAESISVFCTVLKLLGSTLEKQDSARFSVSALSTVYEILDHCRRQFDEILSVVNKLQKEREGGCDAGNGERERKKVEIEVDVLARVKWAFKRGEVKRMQRELDSMKLTLGIMLQALKFRKISVEKRYSAAQRATELEETQCVAECLIAAQNANEEEMSLQEEETDDLRRLSSEAQEQSWRASTYLGNPINSSTSPNPRKQFQNLVHMWADTGESSTSSLNGRIIQRKKDSLASARESKINDSEPTHAPKEHPNLRKSDKSDRTVPNKGIRAALTKFRQARVPNLAVLSEDLDQIRMIAEQEEPETELKADAIRGPAALVRRLSISRKIMESEEARRLHKENQQDLEPVLKGEHIVWDDLRRHRKTYSKDSDSDPTRWDDLRVQKTTLGSDFRDFQDFRQHLHLGTAAFPNTSNDEGYEPYQGSTLGEPNKEKNHLGEDKWIRAPFVVAKDFANSPGWDKYFQGAKLERQSSRLATDGEDVSSSWVAKPSDIPNNSWPTEEVRLGLVRGSNYEAEN